MKTKEEILENKSTSEWRGKILEIAIEIESYLDVILLAYFPKKGVERDFWNCILHNRYFPVFLKIDVIIKTGFLDGGYREIKKDLQRVFDIRNLAAHSKSFYGLPETLPIILKNPKGMKIENLKVLYNELTAIRDRLLPALEKLLITNLKKKK